MSRAWTPGSRNLPPLRQHDTIDAADGRGPMLIGEAARVLGLSTDRVRELDDILNPRRSSGGMRLYDPRAVERLRHERDETREARRAAKEAAKLEARR